MGLSIEISVGDSTGRLFSLDENKKLKKDKSYSLDLVGKVIHTIEVNDELSLVGFIGLDLAREAKKGPAQDALARWDWMRGKRTAFAEWLTDKDRALKRVDSWLADKVKPQYMGGFEETTLNLDVVFGYGAVGRIASAGGADGNAFRIEALNLDGKFRPTEKKVTLVLSVTAGVGSVDGAFKLGGSKAFYLEVPDTLRWLRDQKVLVREFRDAIADVAGPMPDCGSNKDYDQPMCQKGRALTSVNKKLEDARDTSWRIRLSAGHMPLGEVLQLFLGLFR